MSVDSAAPSIPFREFARNATTIMSTQIGPSLAAYLGALEAALAVLEESLKRLNPSGTSITNMPSIK